MFNRRKKARKERRAERRANRRARRDARKKAMQGKRGINRLLTNVNHRQKNFRKNNVEIAEGHAKSVKESRIGEAIDNVLDARLFRRRAKYWPASGGTLTQFPEQRLAEVMKKPNIGICFSGGGSRSAVTSFGIFRGLRNLGYASKFRYTSAVSGGSWFMIPYTFLPRDISDDSFFGGYLPPENLGKSAAEIRQNLNDNAHSSAFCLAASGNKMWSMVWGGIATDTIRDFVTLGKLTGRTSSEMNWSRAVGRSYLKPFGLYDDQRNASTHTMFTWSNATRNDIVSRNKGVEHTDFITVEHDRPFSIANGSMFGRSALGKIASNSFKNDSKLRSAGHLEMTPYYTGITTAHDRLGGGYIESFGMDGYLSKFEGGQAFIKRGQKHERFTITDMAGIASAAMGVIDLSVTLKSGTKFGLDGLSPELKYWSPSDPNVENRFNAIDGGYLENLGILPLLKRKVPKIIAFFNGGTSFHKFGKMPGTISHLFGESEDWIETNITETLGRKKNHVFRNSNGELESLKSNMKLNNAQTGVSFHKAIYQVVENKNYGIKPYQVEILWIVLDESSVWTQAIKPLTNSNDPLLLQSNVKNGETVKQALVGSKNKGSGFPNFNTKRLNLTKEEVALLANHSEWCIRQISPTLQEFFN